MSFINLMVNDLWSDADITNRTEAMLRSQFSVVDEQVLNRKISGATLGVYKLTADDQVELNAFATATFLSQQEGIQAREDMILLESVIEYEKLMKILEAEAETEFLLGPVVLGKNGLPRPRKVTSEPNPMYETDAVKRADATIKIANTTKEVVNLYFLRNPPAQLDSINKDK